MAYYTKRLVGSSYKINDGSGTTSRATVSGTAGLYNNTDGTTQVEFLNSTKNFEGTSYLYVSGFNFSDVPTNAVNVTYSVKIKGYAYHKNNDYTESNINILNNTTQLPGSATLSYNTTSPQVLTLSGITTSWDDLRSYGNNFSVRISIHTTKKQINPAAYIYGIELYVTYDVPAIITTSLTGPGSISPSGSTQKLVGDSFILTITPPDMSRSVRAFKDGSSISLTRGSSSYTYTYTITADATFTVDIAEIITSSLTGPGSISPSGSTQKYIGDTYTLTITPSSMAYSVRLSKDGTRVTPTRGSTNYTYSYTVDGPASFNATITEVTNNKYYVKVNGQWIDPVAVYQKISGRWVELPKDDTPPGWTSGGKIKKY